MVVRQLPASTQRACPERQSRLGDEVGWSMGRALAGDASYRCLLLMLRRTRGRSNVQSG